jgi:flagellar basal body-associated protein FliL
MSDGTWLGQTKKRNNALWIILIVVAAVGAAAIFLHNNSDILWGKKGLAKEAIETSPAVRSSTAPAAPETGPESAPREAPAAADTAAPKARPAIRATPGIPAASDRTPQTSAAASPAAVAARPTRDIGTASMVLGDITCRLADRSKPVLRLSIEMYFPDDPGFAHELLLKRDNLKVLVRKVLSTKFLDDLVVEKLRMELRNVLNGILEKGQISDIEFRDFRIDKVE